MPVEWTSRFVNFVCTQVEFSCLNFFENCLVWKFLGPALFHAEHCGWSLKDMNMDQVSAEENIKERKL